MPPNYFHYFNTQDDLYEVLKTQMSLHFEFGEIEKIFFSLFNIRAQFKAYFSSDESLVKGVGFLKRSATYSGHVNAFLTMRDINQPEATLTELQNEYLDVLNNLIEKGKKSEVKVVFMVALTIEKTTEKKQVLPVFHTIQEPDK